jgi:hypothetical protein
MTNDTLLKMITLKGAVNCANFEQTKFKQPIARTHNIGFAARLAGRWSNGHFIAVVLHLGWTYIVELLFVNLYFYIFNQQRFRAGRAMNSTPAAIPVRCTKLKRQTTPIKTFTINNMTGYLKFKGIEQMQS